MLTTFFLMRLHVNHRTAHGKFHTEALGLSVTRRHISARSAAWSLTEWHRQGGILVATLAQRLLGSNGPLGPREKTLASVMVEVRPLTRVAYLRRDRLGPKLLGIRRAVSQFTRAQFFAGFGPAA